MNLKSRFLLASFLAFCFLNNISAENSIAKKFLAAALAGPSARTLLLENIPAGIVSPALELIVKKENKNKEESKAKNIKWLSRFGCLINSYVLYTCLHDFYTQEDAFGNVKWISPNHDRGRTFVGLVLAALGLIVERETVDALKNSKHFKDNKEVINIIEPVTILGLQYLADKIL